MLIFPFEEGRPHVRRLIQLQLVLKMDIVQEGFLREKRERGKWSLITWAMSTLHGSLKARSSTCSTGWELPTPAGCSGAGGGLWPSLGAVAIPRARQCCEL